MSPVCSDAAVVAHRERREHERAEECFREALTIWTDLGDDEGQAWVAGRYAQVCREQGRYANAVELCQRALAACERSEPGQEAGIVHNNLSGIHRDAGTTSTRPSPYAEQAVVGLRGDRLPARAGVGQEQRGRMSIATRNGSTAAIGLYELVLDERRALGDDYGTGPHSPGIRPRLVPSGDSPRAPDDCASASSCSAPKTRTPDIAKRLLASYESSDDKDNE